MFRLCGQKNHPSGLCKSWPAAEGHLFRHDKGRPHSNKTA
ncbi:hypothetical protein BOO71_0002140 [Deinococcus marmoris]|uniref:Uncharacterized protein n=1 Tax=Deinococcus marmoris TaxID=249408 RepID=A0A1U7P399_9DEIO|nr:hypothetical protein BOO71_0002140 [Deinococcus marmoris]